MDDRSTRPGHQADTDSSPAPPRTAGRRIWLWRLLLVLGAIALAFALGEVAVRALGLGPQIAAIESGAYRLSENAVLAYEYLPGATDGAVKINAAGMRDRDRTVPKPPGTFRIACIGDSICAGFHGPAAETFPARLEHLLNRHYAGSGRTFEVLNFGVTGYNITQAVESLHVRGLAYDPDAIVYAYCLNDVLVYSYEFEVLAAKVTAAERGYFDRMLQGSSSILHRSRLYALLRYGLEAHTFEGNQRHVVESDVQFRHLHRRTYERFFRSHYDSQEGQERVAEGLDRLAELSRQGEVGVYLVVFPVFRDLEDYPLEQFHRRLLSAAEQRGLRGLDLLGAYQALMQTTDEPVAIDFLHPSPVGYGLAAVAILQELLAHEAVLAGGPGLEALIDTDEPEAPLARLLLDQ